MVVYFEKKVSKILETTVPLVDRTIRSGDLLWAIPKREKDFNSRLRDLALEQERLEKEQLNLKSEAEEALKSIDPEIEACREKIKGLENEIEALEQKRKEIENFVAKMNVKGSGHPLRRSQAA